MTSPRLMSRVYRASFSPEVRRDAALFLQNKGCALRPSYAALCLVEFLHTHTGREAVCSADIRALFPHPRDELAGALRNPSDILRRAAVRGLATPLGDGWYAITNLGRAVVDALPNDEQVAMLRGCRAVTCGVGRRRRYIEA